MYRAQRMSQEDTSHSTSCHSSKNLGSISGIAPRDFGAFFVIYSQSGNIFILYPRTSQSVYFLVPILWSLQGPETDFVGWLPIWSCWFQTWSNIWTRAASLGCSMMTPFHYDPFMYMSSDLPCGPLSYSRSMIALVVYAATAILTPCVGSICSGPSFRASASHSTHVKPTYTLTVKPSSCESHKRPCVPSPFRCPRNSDVMKKRDSRNLKVTFLVSLEGIQLPRDPNVCWS